MEWTPGQIPANPALVGDVHHPNKSDNDQVIDDDALQKKQFSTYVYFRSGHVDSAHFRNDDEHETYQWFYNILPVLATTTHGACLQSLVLFIPGMPGRHAAGGRAGPAAQSFLAERRVDGSR